MVRRVQDLTATTPVFRCPMTYDDLFPGSSTGGTGWNGYTAGAQGGGGLRRTALTLGAVVIALSFGAVCGQPPTAAPDAARGGPPVDWAKLVPARGFDITDGQTFAVGDTTLAFWCTPGYAAGGVSTIFTPPTAACSRW
jgi:hypothetical protein